MRSIGLLDQLTSIARPLAQFPIYLTFCQYGKPTFGMRIQPKVSVVDKVCGLFIDVLAFRVIRATSINNVTK